MKHYLNEIICACSDEKFGQDAVEYAVQMGHVTLTYDLEADKALIMSQYDDIVFNYQRQVSLNEAALVESYGPIFDAITDAAAAAASVGEEDHEEIWRDA